MIVYNLTREQKIIHNDCLSFRSKELMYLRLYALGENDKDIARFLGVTKRYVNNIKRRIEKKFESPHWLSIVAKAIDMEILKLPDFAESIVKKEALKYTNEILHLSNEKKPIPPRLLKNMLLTFCNVQKNTPMLKNIKLDEYSIKILNHRYRSEIINDNEIVEEFFQNNTKVSINQVFDTLEVKNWMLAIRKAVLLNIIEDINHEKSDLYSRLQIKQFTSYLNRLLYFDNVSQIEKKQIVYDKLIRLNVDIELYRLFSGIKFGKK